MAAQKFEGSIQNSIGASDVGQHRKRQRDLALRASRYYLPKKSSKRPLGQDGSFITNSKQTVGVADGFGSITWTDSGRYARQLMHEAYHFVESHPENIVDPMAVLQAAFVNSHAKGSCSTACIITLRGNSLHAVNLGDSGFRLIRGGETVYRSPVQLQSFNRPFHLGSFNKYLPSHADRMVVGVERGDVLVAGTNGLFDNLFDGEIEEIVKATIQEGKPPELLAVRLGRIAQAKSLIPDCETPFSIAAADNGYKHSGGMYDDVSVIVGHIY